MLDTVTRPGVEVRAEGSVGRSVVIPQVVHLADQRFYGARVGVPAEAVADCFTAHPVLLGVEGDGHVGHEVEDSEGASVWIDFL